MTVNLPGKAGFAPTVAEWDALVRIAENLAAQVVQAQQDAHHWATLANSAANERDAARAEVARLTERLETAKIALRGCRLAEQARVLNELADNVAELDQQECAALRQPAPATAEAGE